MDSEQPRGTALRWVTPSRGITYNTQTLLRHRRSRIIRHWLEALNKATTSQLHWLSSDWQAVLTSKQHVFGIQERGRGTWYLSSWNKWVAVNIKVAGFLAARDSRQFHTGTPHCMYKTTQYDIIVLFFLLRGVGWHCVHLVRRPLVGPLYLPRVIDRYGAVDGLRIGRGSRSTQRKTYSNANSSTTNPT
jgi:hypothetical protein